MRSFFLAPRKLSEVCSIENLVLLDLEIVFQTFPFSHLLGEDSSVGRAPRSVASSCAPRLVLFQGFGAAARLESPRPFRPSCDFMNCLPVPKIAPLFPGASSKRAQYLLRLVVSEIDLLVSAPPRALLLLRRLDGLIQSGSPTHHRRDARAATGLLFCVSGRGPRRDPLRSPPPRHRVVGRFASRSTASLLDFRLFSSRNVVIFFPRRVAPGCDRIRGHVNGGFGRDRPPLPSPGSSHGTSGRLGEAVRADSSGDRFGERLKDN